MPLGLKNLSEEKRNELEKSLNDSLAVVNAKVHEDEIVSTHDKKTVYSIEHVDGLFNAAISEQEKIKNEQDNINKSRRRIVPEDPLSAAAETARLAAEEKLEKITSGKNKFNHIKEELAQNNTPEKTTKNADTPEPPKPESEEIKQKKARLAQIDDKLHDLKAERDGGHHKELNKEIKGAKKRLEEIIGEKKGIVPNLRPGSFIHGAQNGSIVTLFLALLVGPDFKWQRLYDQLAAMEQRELSRLAEIQRLEAAYVKEKEFLEADINGKVTLSPHDDSSKPDANISLTPHEDDKEFDNKLKNIDDQFKFEVGAGHEDQFKFGVGAGHTPAPDISTEVMNKVREISPEVELVQQNGVWGLEFDKVPVDKVDQVKQDVTQVLTEAGVLKPSYSRQDFLTAASETQRKEQEAKLAEEKASQATAGKTPGPSPSNS